MSIDFSGSRLSYEKDELIEANVSDSPFELFSDWIENAVAEKVVEPYAMSIATCGLDMMPSVRTVLMREVTELDDNDFSVVFYTNYDSSKGIDLAENNNAEVLFFWQELEKQVRIRGVVEQLSSEESTEYFHKRPHKSQVAAWASAPQSGVIANRQQLEQNFEQLLFKYPQEKIVPKPCFWGGYQLVATHVEFWQGRASRMHDRLQYMKHGNEWLLQRLMP